MQGSRVNYVGTDGIDTFAGSRFEFRWISEKWQTVHLNFENEFY